MIRRRGFQLSMLGLLSLAALTVSLLSPKLAAADASYNGADLVDPSIFLNSASMDANAIQSFLVSKGGALANYTVLFDCASTGSTSNSMYVSAGAPCGQNVPASTIIYYAAQIYGINPQVVLATLQKEQSLVTDPSPASWQYDQAMGYACPDNGGCGASNFLYQIDSGTWVLRYHYERANGNNTWWQVKAWSCGVSSRYYTPNLYPHQNVTFIDNSGIHYATYYLANPSTSSLYCYTPHAYNNPQGLYGLPRVGTTGGYFTGSYNFVQSFDAWFGSSTILPELNARYDALTTAGTNLGAPTDDGFCTDTAHDACWQGFQYGYIVYSKSAGAWESYGAIRTRWEQLGYQNGEMGFPDGPIYCTLVGSGCYQQYQNGFIVGSPSTGFWESMGSIRAKWATFSFQDGKMGYPTGGINPTVAGGYYQQYQNGFIVGNNTVGYWESMNGPVRNEWGALGFQNGRLGYPTSAPDCSTQPSSGCIQYFQGGAIYWTAGTGAWQVWGAIGGRWSQLGGDGGSLGYPLSGESCGLAGGGCSQLFQNGYIVGSPASGWWASMTDPATSGPIRDEWGKLGFQNGRLGYPTTAADCSTQPSSGCIQYFQGGAIYWTSTTGAYPVWGAIGGRYAQLGGDSGALGYPVAPESCSLISNGCFQQFQNGYIVGSPATGWWESTGSIRTRWGQLGYEGGELGYPTSAQYCTLSDGGCYQGYQNGVIVGTSGTGYWESSGAIRNKWASLGYDTGALGYPTGAVSCVSGTCSQTYEHGTIYSNQSTSWYTSG